MNILVIDAASPLEIIAVGRDGAAETSAVVNTSHSATILNTIDLCLKKMGLVAGDLDCLGVGVGPGSFTGIRIAVSTARMLAQVLEVPLVGLPTHLLYAISVEAEPNDAIMIAFDAKKGRVFGALYRKSQTDLAPDVIVPPGDYVIEHLLNGVDRARTSFLIGSGIQKYEHSLASLDKRVFLRDFTPSGRIICDLVRETYLGNPAAYGDYNKVLPCYARKSDAEVAKELKENR